MKRDTILKGICACLAVLLAALLCFAAHLTGRESEMQLSASGTAATTDAPTSAPATEPVTEPVTQPVTGPATEPTAAATTEPATAPTTEPATVPTEPELERYVLTFVGDCTLANSHDEVSWGGFLGTVGDDYAYPFADVAEYFQNDDCTFINLECAFTNRTEPEDKTFVFKGPPEYNQILVQGSVEFANIANNHTADYGWGGYWDTKESLWAVDVHFADTDLYTVFTTDSGLTIGVFANRSGFTRQQITDAVTAMRDEGAEIVIVSMHWGDEYWYAPNYSQQVWGRMAIDAGADIVYGHHPHVLQPIEEYNGGIIYYSLGNFSFGGNYDPADKDTALLQQEIVRDPDGTVSLGELTVVPCYVSGLRPGNDFQPEPMEPGTDAYARVLSKLDGTYPEEKLYVSYREETEPTQTETAENPAG